MKQREYEAIVDRFQWRIANIGMVMDWIRADPDRDERLNLRWWNLDGQRHGLMDAWEEVSLIHFGERKQEPPKKPAAARVVLAGAALVLALAGCTGQPPASQPAAGTVDQSPGAAAPTAQEPAQPYSPGTFAFTADGGGTGTRELPGTPVPEIEELRELVGGEPVEYVTAAVDNRKGTVHVNMNQVQVFSPEGRQYTYTGAESYVSDLRRMLPADAPAETYNRFIDVGNKYLDDAAPKEVKDFVLIGEPVPAEIAGITVYATGGFNPVEATPMEAASVLNEEGFPAL